MKAESQTMLAAEALGQQTIQALFMQTSAREQPVVLNCQFQRDPEDGKLYYVFNGTEEHYVQFRALMEDYAVYPVHEIEGHRLNKAKAVDLEVTEEPPVVDTAPAETKSAADVGDAPPELSATEGEVVKPEPAPAAEGKSDEPALRGAEQPADSRKPPAPAGGQPKGTGAGNHADDGRRHGGGAAAGRGAGRKTAAPDGAGAVSAEVKPKSDDLMDLEL